MYIGCVGMEHFQYNVQAMVACADKMVASIKAFKIHQPLKMNAILLDDDDGLVLGELEYWQKLKQVAMEGPRDSRDTTWQKRHQEEFEKAGLRWGHVEAPDVVKASPWFAALPEREQDLVIFTVLTQPDAVSLDVGQSIGRQRVRSCPDISLTVTPSEKRYMLRDRQRLRTACESLALQAIPWEDLDLSVDIPVLHSLAGNAWTGTVAMAVTFGLLAHFPFEKALQGAASDSD